MPSPGHDHPLEFSDVLERELREIETRRDAAGHAPPERPRLAGLALSGGGIRSATFCLGVLQSLRERRVLPHFDYLSTVSGGGFAGGWWSAFLARPWSEIPAGRRPDDTFFPDDERIEAQRENEYQNTVAKRKEGSLNAGVDPVHHLRLFSNYLTPRRGLFGADTWRAVAITGRNVILTWAILLPLLFGAVVAAQLYFVTTRQVAVTSLAGAAAPLREEVRALGSGFTAGSGRLTDSVAREFLAPAPRDAAERASVAYATRLEYRARVAARPLVVLALLFAAFTMVWLLQGAAHRTPLLIGMAGVAFIARRLLDSFGRATSDTPILPPGPWTWLVLIGTAAVVARFVVFPVLGTFFRTLPESGFLYTAEMPLVRPGPMGRVWLWLAGAWDRGAAAHWRAVRAGWVADGARGAYRGLAASLDDGSVFRRERRRNRIAAWQSRVLITLALSAIVLLFAGFSHDLVAWLFGSGGPVAQAGGTLAAVTALGSAVFTAMKGAPAGGADSTLSRPTRLSRAVFAVAPILFLCALLVAFATAGQALIAAGARATFDPMALRVGMLAGAAVCLALAVVEVLTDAGTVAAGGRVRNLRVYGLAGVALIAILLAESVGQLGLALDVRDAVLPAAGAGIGIVVVCLTGVIALGWATDPNLIAMHAFYKARLVRAYLGASNPRRRNHEIRDAAPNDDVRLHKLDNCARGAPYHLVNTTVNLVGGRDLATAQRHAASFVLSKHACGSVRTGWRPTSEYMGGGMTLGTAVAISGAAASPNMGTKSMSGAVAMLLALFNVRLGYWAPTPNRSRWEARQAGLWPFYLLREFLSQTNDLSVYSYLTDGGHFDNTGAYSLVERGCTRIVVADCGADPRPCFSDIGDLIRRCRIDFGAEIRLDARRFLKNAQRLAESHVVVGTVVYSRAHARSLGWPASAWERDDDAARTERTGIVVWIKPALTGAERADIRQYAIENEVFPQQSTADQWFDEAQFESYRSLGYKSGFELPAFWEIDVEAIADAEAKARDAAARNDLAAWLLNRGWVAEGLRSALDASIARYRVDPSNADELRRELETMFRASCERHYREEIVKPLLDRRGEEAAVRALDGIVLRAAGRSRVPAPGGTLSVTTTDLANARADMNGDGWPF